MTDNAFLDFIWGGVVGILAWFFGGLDGFFKVLIAFSCIDYISGTCAAWKKGVVNSKTGYFGIIKKCVLFTFIGIAHILDKNLLGGSDVLRTAVSLFYIGNEGISIIENADAMGIPIPNVLREKLLNLKENHEVKKENESH